MAKDTVARLADRIFTGLEDQCKLRNERGGFGHDEHGRPEVKWITMEREFMFSTVNTERASRGKPPVTMESIRRVESMACGHSDYTRKFAIYCAELVLFVDDARHIQP